jgi:TolA-binding protein
MLLLGAFNPLPWPHARLQAAESTEESIALYADAANFQTSGAIDLAITNWKRFLDEYPDDDLAPKAAHYLGVCYMQKDKPDYVAAADAFAIALQNKQYELREESLANQGWCYYASAGEGPQRDAARLKQTLETFATLRKENPNSDYIDRAYFYSGEAAYGLGNREQAIEFYDRFLKLPDAEQSPLHCDALYAKGIAHEELKQVDQAIASFKQVLDACADTQLAVDVHLRMGDLMIVRGDHSAAVASFDKAIESATAAGDKSYAVFRQAFALVQAGKPNEAAERYDRLQKEFPQSPYAAGATLAAGQSLYRGGDVDAAAERFEKVLKQNNPVAATEAAHWLARIHLAKQDPKSAAAIARRQLDAGAKGDFVIDLKVDLAEALSLDPETVPQSIDVAEQAYRDAPTDPLAPRALYNAAFSSLQVNRYERAAALATEFIKTFPDDELLPDVRFILAESRLLTGKADEALATYQTLLQGGDSDQPNPQRPLWVLRAAVAHNSLRQYDQTIELLIQEGDGFEQPAQRAEAQFLLGQAQLVSSRPAEAAESFGRAVTAAPQWPRAGEAMLLRGTSLLSAGNADQAKQVWTELMRRDPESPMADQARYKLAQAASNAGDHDAAIDYYNAILQSQRVAGLLPYARYGRGWSLMQQGNHQQAIETLTSLIEQQREHPLADDALIARGISYRTVEDFKAAENDLTTYLNGQPAGINLGHALYELALVDQKFQRYGQAAKRLQRLRDEVPDYPSMDKVLYELGWSLSEAGNDEQAAEQFRKLLSNFPNTPFAAEAAYFVGQTHYDQNDWTEAIKYYRMAADKTSDADMKEKALYRLGWSLYKDGKLPEARQAFAKQVEARPDGDLAIDARMMVGECLFKRSQYAEALKSYEQGRETIREADDTAKTINDAAERQVRELILLHGGQSAAQLKRWDEAIEWYDELKQRFPATAYLPQLFYETGFAYQQKGDDEQALKYFEQVAERYRRREVGARARFMMGEIYFAQKKFDQAIPEFQSVMYGFGGEQAPEAIKNWQAKSGFEAGRCGELLLQQARTDEARDRAKQFAIQFYKYVVGKHPGHELAKKSAERLEALQSS